MEKRKKTLLILGLCIFTLTLVGLSYAFWQITLLQTDENFVYTDCLDLEFVGEDNINLQNAYPMTKEEQESFFVSETPYHFTITNQCESKANLSINLETLEVLEEENPLDDDWVDVILYEGKGKYNIDETQVLNNPDEKGYYKVTANEVNPNRLLTDSVTAYNLYNFTINNGETKEFSMYLLLDEETPVETESGKKTTNAKWKGKVTINAAYKPTLNTEGMLRKINSTYMNYGYGDIDEEGMWKYYDRITKIVFENELKSHDDAEHHFDESVDHDGSVMSYLVPNDDQVQIWESGESKSVNAFTAYIQGDGGIKGNPDSSSLFYGFEHVKSIEGLNYFDTSQVENMSSMFSLQLSSYYESYSALTNLDLIALDTSSATDMSYMFRGLALLETLNLGSHFDTSKVTNMSYMFSGIGLSSLDLSQSNFDTSSVTDMSGMFTEAKSLASLDLGDNFNAGNVTNMSYIFSEMDSLISLDLGDNFNASSITDVSSIFSYMKNLRTLDLGDNFNASSVTDMSLIFDYLENLETLNLGKNFNSINVTDMSQMFYDLPKLTTLDLGDNFDTRNVEDMSLMFQDLPSLETLNLGSHFNTSKVTDMDQMFQDDSSLTHIDYGEYFIHKEDVTINRMFAGCPDTLNKSDINTHPSWEGVTWE